MSSKTMQKQIEKAIRSGDPAAIDKALASVSSISAPTSDPAKFTTLGYAAEEGIETAVSHLLSRGANPNLGTPLNAAAIYGRDSIARMLIEAGANVNARTSTGSIILMKALFRDTPGHLACVELLVRSGADVNVVNDSRIVNVVMDCALGGSIQMMEILVSAGARVNDIWRRGTALTCAVEKNQLHMVEWLLKHGADATLKVPADSPFPDVAGLTALQIAQKLRLKKIVALLESASGPVNSEESGPKSKSEQKKPARSVSVGTAAERIREALSERGLLKQAKLQRPATDAQIAAWEKKMGRSLPADLAKAYGVHNGQKSPDFGLFPPPDDPDDERFDWLSLAESQSEWSVWQDVGESEPGRTCAAHPGVRELWWHSGWIPFASNGGGDVLCVDTSPAKGGKKGQVISVSHESGARRLLAPSLAAYLAEVAESISSDETIDSD